LALTLKYWLFIQENVFSVTNLNTMSQRPRYGLKLKMKKAEGKKRCFEQVFLTTESIPKCHITHWRWQHRSRQAAWSCYARSSKWKFMYGKW